MTTNLNIFRTLLFAGLIVLMPAISFSQSLAQWRGADHRGIYPEPSALATWPEAGPALAWSSDKVGDGYGSPVILDGKVYICGTSDSTAILSVFTTDGKPLIRVPFALGWATWFVSTVRHSMKSGA